MRSSALATLTLLLTACPGPKNPDPTPEPSGRCEVDLDALEAFSKVGTTASAKVVASASELIGGNFAQGRVGDVLLQNDRVRVVIQQPTRAVAPIAYGGTIIDADVQRPSGAGRDEFGKVGLIYAFGRTVNVSKVEVLRDGSEGGYAVVAATGSDTVVDYINVKNVLTDYLGNVQLVRDPEAPLPFTVTTYYVLSPGESRVRMLSAFCNTGKDAISMQVGDLIDQGGVGDTFNPQSCSKELGAHDCLVDPAPWLGIQTPSVAYGYRTYEYGAPNTPVTNAVITIAGISAVVAGAENQSGFLSWVAPDARNRPGTFGVLGGKSRNFLRDFFVGGDLGEISAAMAALDGTPTSKLSVTVHDASGAAAAGTRVTVRGAESGRMVTLLVADDQGVAHAQLPPGNYKVGAAALGFGIEPLADVSVPSNGTADVTVSLGGSQRLTVDVADPFGQPLTSKVLVRCVSAPCVNQAIAYRSWFDTEPQPSELQRIVHVGADGHAVIEVPPGQYEVLVTRGPEYSAWPDGFPAHGEPVDLTAGPASVHATLAHVVDSTGWLSADLHVHAMGSPDSAVGNPVRAMSFAAEGVDVLVSTDHDFVTDYAPIIEQLQLGGQMTSMIGCEVTPFDFGHHNAFPLIRKDTVNGGAFDWAGGDGPTLRLDQMYAGLRAENPDALIQMNHPRGSPGGALTMTKIDTATGATHADPATFRQVPSPDATALDTKLFSNDFDALEVMNGTAPRIGVLNDWMTFLSRGWVKVGTGVSDSHYVYDVLGGYGRTWIQLGTDELSAFTPEGFTQAMRQRHATFSSGPFITMTAQVLDAAMQPVGPAVGVGDLVSVSAGQRVQLTVDVQAPEWMQFDSIEIHTHAPGREATNGEENGTLLPPRAELKKSYTPSMLPLEAVPGLNGFSARRVHVHETFVVTADSDTWFLAMARASSASSILAPLAWDGVSCSDGLCTPSNSRAWAVTNPVFVDADGSGAYDDFPLKPGQPLSVAQPVSPGPRRVPSTDEFEAFLRAILKH